jgi:hypothetical protein
VPALPSVADVMRVTLFFMVGSDATALSRFFNSYSGAVPNLAAITSFAGVINAAADDALPAVMHPDTSYLGCTIQDLSSDEGIELTQPESTAGSRSGGPLGADVCALWNIPIGRHYRGGKPRMYWPLGTDTDLETRQTWTTDAQAAFQAAFTAVYGALDGASSSGTTPGAPVNVSYYGPPNAYKGVAPGRVRTVSTLRTAAIVDQVTGGSVNIRLASQRRRNLFRHH